MVRGTLDVVLVGGLALGLVALTGCGSSGNSGGGGGGGGTTAPTGALASGGATTLYAIENYYEPNESILQFSLSGAGSVSPTSTLLAPTTLIVGAVATDSSGQIYVGGALNPGYEILVYAAGASGAATPLRTITLDAEGEFYPVSMTVDASGKLYAAGESQDGSFSGVAVFDATANGAATPIQLIQNAGVQEPLSMAVDTSGKVYLSGLTDTSGEIVVFAAGATGNATPIQTISTVAATSTTVTVFWGLAVDASGDLYTVQDTETGDSSGDVTGMTAEIEEFAAGATGSPTPIKTISGSKTGLALGGGMRVDGVGNIYLANEVLAGTTVTNDLLAFGPNASGNVAPGLDLSSTALTSPAPEIAVH
jgi:hypothetical protein